MRTVPPFPHIVPGLNGGALQFLLITRNPILRLERASFENQPDLLQVDLSFNQMVWISKGAFLGVPSLRSLSLRGNRLAQLPHQVFMPVFMLEDLDLSKNQLRNIPTSLEGLVYLRRLSLFGNPLHCPCELVDFSISLIQLETSRAKVTCLTPPEVANFQLVDLGRRILNVTNTTRMCGYQDVDDSERQHFIQTQPFVPMPKDLKYAWPWPHCPLRDFGGVQWPFISDSSEDEGSLVDGEEDTQFYAVTMSLGIPRWTDTPQSVHVVAGDMVHFVCGADGQRDLQISWAVPLNATKHMRLLRRREILEIYETHDYHEGTYTCIVTSAEGQRISADATLRLVQPTKARITVAPPADNNVAIVGSDLELLCSSKGRPRPKISWLWQEETLPLHLVTGGRYIVRSYPSGMEPSALELYSLKAQNKYIKDSVAASETTSVLHIRNISQKDAHGRYICYASNRMGSARVSTIIQVLTEREASLMYSKSVRPPQISTAPKVMKETEETNLSWDELVRHVIEKARVRIEAAIKNTADRLRDPSRRRSSADVASLFRQPSRAALELAKAAEVYEAVVDEVNSILRQGGHRKLDMHDLPEAEELTPEKESDPNSRQAFGIQLSADQLAIISQLSGCQESSSIDQCSQQLCFHLRYRSVDGACNNFNHPRWGAALAPFKRLLPPQYENEINTPVGWSPTRMYFGYPKPSARLVSIKLLGDATLLGRHTSRLKSLEEWNKIRREKTRLIQGGHFSNRSTTSLELSPFSMWKFNFEEIKNNMKDFEEEHGSLFDEDDKYSGMLMQWGQFLDHDLDFTPVDASISRYSDGLNCNETCVHDPPCFPIMVAPDDPRIKHRCIGFSRSSATCGSGSTSILLGKPHYREQLNQITAFIDASNVYGSDEFENSQLRETLHDEGKMRTGMPTPANKPLLPFNIRGQVDCQADPSQDFVPCFKAGDHRSNENLGLLTMHTLWVRQHNVLADGLRSLNADWSGDRIYHEARKIVGACMQAITYQVWLPMILGPEGMKLMGRYTGYDDKVNPTISNEFATAAMRFGHTLVSPIQFRLDENWEPIPEGHLQLHQSFFAPDRMLKDGGMDPIIRGLLFNGVRDRSRNPPLNVELTERLFSMAHELALDLAALNIQRGRDHGLPGYTEYAHRFCGFGDSAHPDSFDDLAPRISNPVTRERLRMVYGHPGNIDLFAGAILEDLLPEARVGPTFACMIADQFKRLRDGDRFWYEYQGVFTPAQLAEIKRAGSSLSRLVCETADNITEVPKNGFLRPSVSDDIVPCSKVPKINLEAWIDCSLASSEFNPVGSSLLRRRRSAEHVTSDSCPIHENDAKISIQNMQKQVSELSRKLEDVLVQVNEMKSTWRLTSNLKNTTVNPTG